MKNTWFSSDWHYGHKNIVKGESTWEDKSECRGFNTLAEHNAALVQNINTYVKPEDEIWFLGDFAFGSDNIDLFWNRLKCKNIHIILGNHDHHIRNNKLIPNTFTDNTFTTPMRMQGLFKSVQEKFIGKICDQYMTLDHYSHRVWNKSHHGAWMLYGHSHGTLEEYGKQRWTKEWTEYDLFKTMDVGIDTHSEFRPYHFDEIAEIMKNRVPLQVDHHNSKTN